MIQQGEQGEQASPTKSELIRTLKTLCPLLEKKDYQSASKYFVLPENFQPEMLSRILELREVSMAGIERLERDAKFGKASDVFESKRAAALVERAGVDVDQCYGFNHETDVATGEVIAFWNGSQFKLARLDDVGKLLPLADKPMSGPDSSASKPDSNSSVPNPSAAPKLDAFQLAELKIAESKDPLEGKEWSMHADRVKQLTSLTAEQAAKLLPDLASKIEADPNNLDVVADYALVLIQVGNYPEAFKQVLRGHKLDDQDARIAIGLNGVMGKFQMRGLFSIGVPLESIRGVLGDPDRERIEGENTSWLYGFYRIDFHLDRVRRVVNLVGVGAASFHPSETVNLGLDDRFWKLGGSFVESGRSADLYYMPGQTVADWSEQVEVIRFPNQGQTSVEEIVQVMESRQARDSSLEIEKIFADEVTATFLSKRQGAGTIAGQTRITRFIRGAEDLFQFSYAVKQLPMPNEMQTKWLEIAKSISLKPTPPPSGSPQK